MKKLFFFAASLLVAGSMMAQVNIDLSNGENPAFEEGDNAVLDYSASTGELTVTATAGKQWGAPGVKFVLDEPIAVTDLMAFVGSMKCTEAVEETTMIPFFVNDEGNRMWQDDYNPGTTEFADWGDFTALPDAYLWDESETEIAATNVVAVGVVANADTPLQDYVFYLKELMLITNGSGIIEVMSDHKVSKAMVNGQLVIIRNGVMFNALGAAL